MKGELREEQVTWDEIGEGLKKVAAIVRDKVKEQGNQEVCYRETE